MPYRTLRTSLKREDGTAAATVGKAVHAGIDLELGSIVFCGEPAAIVSGPGMKPVEEVIAEEKRRLSRLQGMLASEQPTGGPPRRERQGRS